MKTVLVATCIALSLAGPAVAKSLVPAFIDVETAVKVHSGPGQQYPVVDVLPFNTNGTQIFFSEARGEWLHVEDAGAPAPSPARLAHKGWIYGPLCGVYQVYVGSNLALHKAPRKASPVVDVLVNKGNGPVYFRIHGYHNGWMLVDSASKHGIVPSRRVHGWIPPRSYCGNPFTTCDPGGLPPP